MGKVVSEEIKNLGYELYQSASLARVLREMIQESAQGLQWGEDATCIVEILAERLDQLTDKLYALSEGKARTASDN